MDPITRRAFVLLSAPAALARHPAFPSGMGAWEHPFEQLAREESGRIFRRARIVLAEEPRTITSAPAKRSAGGLHDYFSEGDYWWPDPKNPTGPYIRRDGESNPDNFVAHRELLIRLSMQVPALAAAWLMSKEQRFADHAGAHLKAWFIAPETRMKPSLEYAQAIHGIDTGRSIGIIDTLHLVEVAQAARVMERNGGLGKEIGEGTRAWFRSYLGWLVNSDRGQQERDQRNNHGSCWLLQAAAFAIYTGDDAVRGECRRRLKDVILPQQVASDGSFPLELARTKPYSYSLFNLDVLGMNAYVLSDASHSLWTYKPPDGGSLEAAFQFMTPFVADKKAWPYRHDVEYFDDLPVRQPSLLFAGMAYRRPDYIQIWRQLNPDPTVPEIIRNHPIRQPLLWINR